MKPELEPLETDVLALLRAERPIADLEPAAKAAILASVEARVALLAEAVETEAQEAQARSAPASPALA